MLYIGAVAPLPLAEAFGFLPTERSKESIRIQLGEQIPRVQPSFWPGLGLQLQLTRTFHRWQWVRGSWGSFPPRSSPRLWELWAGLRRKSNVWVMGRGKTEAARTAEEETGDTDVCGKLKPLTEDAFTCISFH